MITIHEDAHLRVRAEAEVRIHQGVQPFLFKSANGAMFVQSQLAQRHTGTSDRIRFHWRLGSSISRDGGQTWDRVTRWDGGDEPLLEGGCVQLADGAILFLDTYATPGAKPDLGLGRLWVSPDDWRTIDGPIPVEFHIPEVDFDGSKDDGGHLHRAMRLHRSILSMPNGDLLTCAYGWLKDDVVPSDYEPTMKKARAMLFRSTNSGRHWDFAATIAAGPVGTEGYVEPVLLRLSSGQYVGRLLCLMRTGREIYGTVSDDEGATWRAAEPVAFPGLDIRDTRAWEGMFRAEDHSIVKRYPEMTGAFVDPDLVELENGVVVCAVGLRVPEKACFAKPDYARNGNYLAFSRNGGQTWSHVLQLTSGVMTTHYMGICGIRPNQLYVTYDLGQWGEADSRTMGCLVHVDAVG